MQGENRQLQTCSVQMEPNARPPFQAANLNVYPIPHAAILFLSNFKFKIISTVLDQHLPLLSEPQGLVQSGCLANNCEFPVAMF